MLLVKVMIPLVYAGANVFIAHCLLFFGQYVFNEKLMIHWYRREDVLILVSKCGRGVVNICQFG